MILHEVSILAIYSIFSPSVYIILCKHRKIIRRNLSIPINLPTNFFLDDISKSWLPYRVVVNLYLRLMGDKTISDTAEPRLVSFYPNSSQESIYRIKVSWNFIHPPDLPWKIVVELTLAGRTAQYIVDRFDCSISTMRWIRKRYGETGRWQRLPGSGRPKKTTARDECYLGRFVKRIRFRLLAQITQRFVTHLGHPVSKSTAVLLHKNGHLSRE